MGTLTAVEEFAIQEGAELTPQEKLRRFEEEISPHLAPAYNLARWLTRNHEDAEDVVQEAFLRAFTSFDTFRGKEGRPWLLAIVRNTCLTWMKRNRNTLIEAGERIEESSAAAGNPETLLLAALDREQIHRALEQLPSEFREAMVLREIEELPYKEIAAITGAPLGTVMSRLSRGRDWLRRLLAHPAKEPAI